MIRNMSTHEVLESVEFPLPDCQPDKLYPRNPIRDNYIARPWIPRWFSDITPAVSLSQYPA